MHLKTVIWSMATKTPGHALKTKKEASNLGEDRTTKRYDVNLGPGLIKPCRFSPDMEFVKKFTPPDFQVKNFTLGFSPNLNSFSKKKHKNGVKMQKFTPLAKILHCRRQ